jgi:hypothetical protein
MRIYLDSNILRKTETTSNQFSKSVLNAVDSLKECFIFLFSEAHLHDLSKAQIIYRDKDLKHMARYVHNNYICRDHIKKELHYYLATPAEAYDGIDFLAMDAVLENPYKYINEMFDFEGGEQFKGIFKNLFNMPIFNPPEIDNSVFSLEQQSLFEEFDGVRSINDALKKFKGVGEVLDNPKDFKKYRNLLKAFIDRKEYSFEEWSFEFDERMKDTLFGKTFSEMTDITIGDANKNDEYTRFINAYTSLEFLGVTEERSGRKQRLKKNSYWDIHKDAVHTFFASKTDYFVTDDMGVQTKAFILYKLFGITTEVLSGNDFIAKAVFLLKNEDNIGSFIDGITYSLKKGFVINRSIVNNVNVIKTIYPVLNYFNRVQVNSNNKDRNIQLFRSSEIKGGIMFAEIDMLINKSTKLFGNDVDFKGKTQLADFGKFGNGEFIRKWKCGKSIITITWEVNTVGDRIIVLTIWL